jgi:uncharacterized protein (TIGR03083 family)
MTDYGMLYGATRERLGSLVRDLDDTSAATPVPACPGWTVHDVVAHLAGTVTDVLAGNLDGVGGDAWTGAQVAARRDVAVAELVDEWDKGSAQFEDGLRAMGGAMAATAVSDVFQHEQDVRSALDRQGGRDHDVMLTIVESYVPGLARRIGGAGLGALRIEAGAHGFTAGDGDPVATARAEPFELVRALGGRRTVDEIRALAWEGDAAAYAPIFSNYGIPERSIDER